MESSRAVLRDIVSAFAGKRILAIGDLMLDEFIWGKVSRISPEAPVPVVNVIGESYYPGGAANVARNLREFTSSVAVMGLAGVCDAGRRLVGLLQECGIDTSAVMQDAARPTAVKTRIIARNQQVVRVDRESPAPLTEDQTTHAIATLERLLPSFDAIVVADYAKGFITQRLADAICVAAQARGKILTVDPHPHTSISWKGATAVKPNRLEAFLAAGMAPAEPISPVLEDRALLEAGRRLLEKWTSGSLLITLGEHGMLLLEGSSPPYHIGVAAKDVFDVSGAGDTALAVFTLGLTAGATARQAAELANHASGIVVGKLGTATVTPAELQARIAAI